MRTGVEDFVPAASAQISWCSVGAGDPCGVIKCRRNVFVQCIFSFFFPPDREKVVNKKKSGGAKPRERLICLGKCVFFFFYLGIITSHQTGSRLQTVGNP